jgi:hypothetical protein
VQGRRGDGPARLFCILVALAFSVPVGVGRQVVPFFTDVPLSFSIPIPNKEIA